MTAFRPFVRRRCRSRALRLLGLPALALTLTACNVALFPEKQAQRVFTLTQDQESERTADPEPRSNKQTLTVQQPEATGIHDSNRLVIEIQRNELAAYSGARWVADAPVLVRDYLVQALREDPRLPRVVPGDSGVASEMTLTSSLKAFQEDRSTEPFQVRITLQAQLVENGSRKVISTRDFNIREGLQGSDVDDTVGALENAANGLATQVAEWLLEQQIQTE